MHVRPFVVLLCLPYLTDQEHDVFAGRGSVAALTERMHLAVQRDYVETDVDKDLKDRLGHLPESKHWCKNIKHITARKRAA